MHESGTEKSTATQDELGVDLRDRTDHAVFQTKPVCARDSLFPVLFAGIQRGCLGEKEAATFKISGNSYRDGGDCQAGQPVTIQTNYSSQFSLSSLKPTYRFSGTYCLCRGDRCN